MEFRSLLGTMSAFFKIGGTSGVRLKNSTGNLLVRNTGDTADAAITASTVSVSGDSMQLNSDAADTGADRAYTLARPAAGMTAAVTLTFPPTAGSPGQGLTTDGTGAMTFTDVGTSASALKKDTTTLAFSSLPAVAMFTLPADAIVHEVRVIIDPPWSTAAQMSVGIATSMSKYSGVTDVDLQQAAGTAFIITPNNVAVATTEALQITYVSMAATAGSARVEVEYSVPA